MIRRQVRCDEGRTVRRCEDRWLPECQFA